MFEVKSSPVEKSPEPTNQQTTLPWCLLLANLLPNTLMLSWVTSYLCHWGLVYVPVDPWEDLHLVWNNGHQLGLCSRDKGGEINVRKNKGLGCFGVCGFAENTVEMMITGLRQKDPGFWNGIALTPVDIFGSLEEARDIVLKHSEGLVQLLKDSDHGVMLLHVLLRLSHCYLCIEASGEWLDKT